MGEDYYDEAESVIDCDDNVKWQTRDNLIFTPATNFIEHKNLPPAEYTVHYDDYNRIIFSTHESPIDDLLYLPDSVSDEIITYVDEFWNSEERFRQYGYLWKRGILLYGPPGSGKTCTLQQVSKRLITLGGIVLFSDNPTTLSDALQTLRKIEPKRPVIVMLEDVDTIIENYGEHRLLPLLNGEYQVDNVIFIATTNHPEVLGRRFTNRPSRFDLVKKIGMPSAEARKFYLEATVKKANDTIDNIEEWIESTEGYSVAHLKELLVSIKVFKTPFDEAIATLNDLISSVPSSDEDEEDQSEKAEDEAEKAEDEGKCSTFNPVSKKEFGSIVDSETYDPTARIETFGMSREDIEPDSILDALNDKHH